MPRWDLSVNGRQRAVEADGGTPLLVVLREQLEFTGAKYGCGEGQCGACTVLVNGKAVRSCVYPVSSAPGAEITTIEGLAGRDPLHPVQQAFLDTAAFQCGFCTPGMILGAVALLRAVADPSPSDVARGLNGHICRCGTYPRIVEAVRLAARRLR